MSANIKAFIGGVATLIIGLVLWRFGGGVEIPIFSLDKVGLVLIVIGGLEILGSLAYMIFGSKKSSDQESTNQK